jgi:ADP-heptose:LPS heptosyltransferase
MKIVTLVILDSLLVPILAPLFLIFYFPIAWIVQKLKYKKENIILIKFLGAGNLIALHDDLNIQDVSIITSENNHAAATLFLPNSKQILISTSSAFQAICTISKVFFKLMTREYNQVVNLEAESKLAKLLVLCAKANLKQGISNNHRSIIDNIIYSNYIVPTNQQRVDIYRALVGSKNLFETNEQSKFLCMHAQYVFLKNFNITRDQLVISIYPSCSDSEKLRRLPSNHWFLLIDMLLKTENCSVKVVFPAGQDIQKSLFSDRYLNSSVVTLVDTTYSDFVDSIRNSCAIFSVDSSAVHVAQRYAVPAFVFYGPTNPFSIYLSHTSYPISLDLMCSPCIYKYFKPPCNGMAPCMNYGTVDFLNSIRAPVELLSKRV